MAARHWLTLTLALCGAVAVTGAEAAAKKKAKAVAAGPAPIARGCTYGPPEPKPDRKKSKMGGAKFAAPLGLMARRSTPLRYRESK